MGTGTAGTSPCAFWPRELDADPPQGTSPGPGRRSGLSRCACRAVPGHDVLCSRRPAAIPRSRRHRARQGGHAPWQPAAPPTPSPSRVARERRAVRCGASECAPARSPAPPVAHRRRHSPSGHRLVATAGKRRVVGMVTMAKKEVASLSALRTRLPNAAPDVQEPAVAQGIRRPPVARRPGSRTFTSCDPVEKRALPFVQGGPLMHEHQPTPHQMPCIEPKGWQRGSGSCLGLFWDFRLRPRARARNSRKAIRTGQRPTLPRRSGSWRWLVSSATSDQRDSVGLRSASLTLRAPSKYATLTGPDLPNSQVPGADPAFRGDSSGLDHDQTSTTSSPCTVVGEVPIPWDADIRSGRLCAVLAQLHRGWRHSAAQGRLTCIVADQRVFPTARSMCRSGQIRPSPLGRMLTLCLTYLTPRQVVEIGRGGDPSARRPLRVMSSYEGCRISKIFVVRCVPYKARSSWLPGERSPL